MNHSFYKSIKGRFFLITLALMLFVGIATSAFSYQMFSKNLTSNSIHSAETNLQFLTDSINTSLSDVLYLTDWCRSNDNIITFVMTPKDASSYNRVASSATDRLAEEYRTNHSSNYIRRLVISNQGRDDYLQVIQNTIYSIDKPIPSMVRELPYYERLLTAPDYDFTIGFQEDPFHVDYSQTFPLIRPVYHPYNSSTIGFVYIELSASLFTGAAQKYVRSENTTVYFSTGSKTYAITPSKIVLSSDLEHLEDYSYDVHLNNNTILRKSASGDSQLYITIPLKAEGCSMTIPISNSSIFEQSDGYLRILFPILLLILVFGILLYITLSRTVTHPVGLLRSRLLAIAAGDFSQDASIEWNNEFGDIGRNINQLAIDIHNLIDEKVSSEKQKKNYEYQILQSQINPHFLYNTLNSIKWMATIQNAPGIAEMATALSHLLKNIAKGTSTIVTIQDEIVLLDDYFTIQKYRYGGTISLDYQIDDPVLLKNPTLRFTLQPIVENAIFHGIEPKGQNGHITIHIYQISDKDMRIDITDDGVGMDETTIASVLNGDSAQRSQFFKQLGISSVHKQIQYTFGESYGLTITSKLNEFTKMSILLPYQPQTDI